MAAWMDAPGHRPKIYRFVDLLETAGGEMRVDYLRDLYMSRFGESLQAPQDLREALGGVDFQYKTSLTIYNHAVPRVFDAKTNGFGRVVVCLRPRAKETLDRHYRLRDKLKLIIIATLHAERTHGMDRMALSDVWNRLTEIESRASANFDDREDNLLFCLLSELHERVAVYNENRGDPTSLYVALQNP